MVVGCPSCKKFVFGSCQALIRLDLSSRKVEKSRDPNERLESQFFHISALKSFPRERTALAGMQEKRFCHFRLNL